MPFVLKLDSRTPLPARTLYRDTRFVNWVWRQALEHTTPGMEVSPDCDEVPRAQERCRMARIRLLTP